AGQCCRDEPRGKRLRALSQWQPAFLCRAQPGAADSGGGGAVMRFFRCGLVALAPFAFGVVTLTFALIHLVPGDPVIAMLGENAAAVDIAGMRHQLGLDRPLPLQYLDYLEGLIHGDLGSSISFHEPVSAV